MKMTFRRLGKSLSLCLPRIVSTKDFSSRDYWNLRYLKGGTSGEGSYGNLAFYKRDFINEFVTSNNIQNVMEFGSGDGNQLVGMNILSYVGFDVSPKAIELCEKKFKNDQTKTFKLVSEYDHEVAELVISMDVIYHLIEDDVYYDYMNMLFNASSRWVLIYSSDFELYNHGIEHVRHRQFTAWVKQNRQDFALSAEWPNTMASSDPSSKTFTLSAFFLFEKI